jgi:hypothetical protein
MQKVLFITPHLSTGGCPQYLLKKIEMLKDTMDIYVVEHSYLGPAYVVQRNAIISLLPSNNFFSLNEDKSDILSIIEYVSPDIIHFEELSESMFSFEILNKIYCKEGREYFITETTHSSLSDPNTKSFLPDRFIFVSQYSLERYKILNVPSIIWEYPIEIQERIDRNLALKKLDLDPKKMHILNVGLFTPGKNQAEIIEIARECPNIIFHFVGNQASNFEHYWKPLMNNRPSNCIIWGERDDVNLFMQACDLFYFSSRFELNPLVIKEALSYQIPIIMYNLPTYMNAYDNTESIHFINGDKTLTLSLINKFMPEFKYKTKIVHIVSDLNSDIEKQSIDSISLLASEYLEYTIHLNPITEKFDPFFPPVYPGLKPAHFGCFNAFRKAICEDFTEDFDFLIICERDCILEKSIDEIRFLLSRTYKLMLANDILYFSFGDKSDLDNGYLQSDIVQELEDFAYITNKIIGLQFIILSNKGVKFLIRKFKETDWHGMDIWLNIVFSDSQEKMAILNERVTTQIDGVSLIDGSYKNFKKNV